MLSANPVSHVYFSKTTACITICFYLQVLESIEPVYFSDESFDSSQHELDVSWFGTSIYNID